MAVGYEHPVDEHHEAILKTILKLDEGLELPDEVKREYWKIKRPADRIGHHLDGGDLIRIALAAFGSTPEVGPYSFLPYSKNFKAGDPVVAEWRGNKTPAKFVRVKGKQVVVLFDDGTAEERSIPHDKVWMEG